MWILDEFAIFANNRYMAIIWPLPQIQDPFNLMNPEWIWDYSAMIKQVCS